MTPKEKAKELIEGMYLATQEEGIYGDLGIAKDCALIAVEEIKEAIFWHPFESPNFELEYWQEVKQEIEKL
jgi:hypothetical protein